MKETRIVFMGTPDFAVPSLKALIDAGYAIPAVVTRPDRPKGRGRGEPGGSGEGGGDQAKSVVGGVSFGWALAGAVREVVLFVLGDDDLGASTDIGVLPTDGGGAWTVGGSF